MGRRRSFDRAQIAHAALAVVDRDGLAALSMRAVADYLGTGAMTLYNYVADREELEGLVVDAVSATIDRTEPGDDWRDDVEAICLSIADAVQRHPAVAPLMLTRRSTSAEALQPAETLLGALNRAGLTDAARLVAFRTVLAVVMGIVQANVAGPITRPTPGVDAKTLDRFAQLDPTRFPNLIALSTQARTSSLDAEVMAGVRLVISGIDARNSGR